MQHRLYSPQSRGHRNAPLLPAAASPQLGAPLRTVRDLEPVVQREPWVDPVAGRLGRPPYPFPRGSLGPTIWGFVGDVPLLGVSITQCNAQR